MSVINKVLKDLDRRGQQPFSKRAASSAVERRSSHRLGLWLLALMLLIVLALVVFWWQSRSENTMTVTESEPAEMPKLQERVEPFIDTAVIEVPAERTPRSESDSRQSSEIVSQDLASVVIPETEPEKAEKAESMPEEPVVNAEDTENETQKGGEFSKQPVQLSPAEISAQHIEKAQKAQQQGRLTAAEDHWRKALAVTPENKEVRKKLAALQFGRNKVSQALTTLEAGFKLNPNDFEFRLLSARILEKEARPAAALSLLKQATPDAGAYPQYVQKQALLAQAQGDYKAAADAYQRLVESEPEQGRWYLGKAVAQQEFAPEAAVASYQEAFKRIKHQPTLDFIEQQITSLQVTEAGEQ
ncbi:tetratricopeptide repeat protein [Idiomarina loihiensis]|uniref:tetratricopeptide repeat protein n=1 Tax=Idiomarina loihiensis TaxID=135577 RepID=UPI00129C263C|nr:tetratricopeptide repeat protein [Idiomarina loihiensis]MRJ45336.1 tetratricopeptide repeat protein [Idiomarina loihiensis]UTW32297.1 tetratricopeptide repeat protein [Idiomarina loihiensis]